MPDEIAGQPLHDHHEAQSWFSRSWVIFTWAFVAMGLLVGAWSISTPLGAAPDEPSHVIAAASAVRGHFGGKKIPADEKIGLGLAPYTKLPQWIANITKEACFAGRPNVPASCSPPVGSSARTVYTLSQFLDYPPLYYFIVGIPTLVSTGSGALWGMQFLGALMDATLLALGLFLLARYHPRRLTLFGAMVALSPMVLFVCAVVNSSGLETAAGFAAWCAGLCVVARREVPLALAVWTSLCFVLLILSRPISPFNAAVIVAVLLTLLGWRSASALVRQRNVRPIWLSGLAAIVVAVSSFVVIGLPTLLGPPERRPLSAWGAVSLTLRMTGGRLRQLVGDFGWLDTPSPTWVVVVWTLVFLSLVVYAFITSRRCREALALLALVILLMPVIFESPEINTVGPYWQGRYWLPLAVGLALVAATAQPRTTPHLESHAMRTGALVGVGALLGVAQVGAFLEALRRYETGLGPKTASHPLWTPLGGTILVVTLFIVGLVVLVGFVVWHYYKNPIARDPSGPSPSLASTHLAEYEKTEAH